MKTFHIVDYEFTIILYTDHIKIKAVNSKLELYGLIKVSPTSSIKIPDLFTQINERTIFIGEREFLVILDHNGNKFTCRSNILQKNVGTKRINTVKWHYHFGNEYFNKYPINSTSGTMIEDGKVIFSNNLNFKSLKFVISIDGISKHDMHVSDLIVFSCGTDIYYLSLGVSTVWAQCSKNFIISLNPLHKSYALLYNIHVSVDEVI